MKEIDVISPDLRKQLSDSLGFRIRFSNGCYINLKDDNGVFWGTGPYGLDWICNSDESWIDSVCAWLKYWNENRDEAGNIIDVLERQ